MTISQIERVKREIKELTTKLQRANEKLAQTLEIAKSETGWEEWVEEDTNKVEYYTRHINRLKAMIEGVA